MGRGPLRTRNESKRMKNRPRYVITLEPLPDAVPAMVRLRKYLKLALRSFRLKCIEAVEQKPDPKPPQADGSRGVGGD